MRVGCKNTRGRNSNWGYAVYRRQTDKQEMLGLRRRCEVRSVYCGDSRRRGCRFAATSRKEGKSSLPMKSWPASAEQCSKQKFTGALVPSSCLCCAK
ncbi:hypothetical protein GQ54DRAFT_206545 [Martensiomyces pterosporus]|nr:hypothetical protein GQ54DRAFT_206545 [Martensiomyces pterosporus]